MAKRKITQHNVDQVKQILDDNYEEGRQDRCKMAIFRNKIFPVLGISERTFWRYLKVKHENSKQDDPRQLKLFD